jgi:small-conductance mechanosensitive channel
MQGIVYEEQSFLLFVIITVILGGGAAWITGRAMATAWRGWIAVFVSILGLGVAVRFIHHALFGGTMFSLHYYVADTIVLLIIASLGYRVTRVRQMTTQYSWLYERTGPFGWRDRSASETARQ